MSRYNYPVVGSNLDPSVVPGWTKLVVATLNQLQALQEDTGVQIIVSDVKEKFGGLRMSVAYESDKPNLATVSALGDTIVSDAEKLSFKTCMTCGAPGNTCSPSGYWLVTLCTTCLRNSYVGGA